MATNLSPYERERFEYGEVAGDNKGDLLRIHAIKAEHTANLLFTWLSGASSEVRLPTPLWHTDHHWPTPVVRSESYH